MASNALNNKGSKYKLNDTFRMVIIDDDTLKEVKSARFSITGVVSLLVAGIITIMALTYCLVAFTPLKHLVPGYADINNNAVYMELSQKIEELEADINAQRVYTEGFKNFLNPTGAKLDDISGNDATHNAYGDETFAWQELNLAPIEHYYFCSPLKGEISAEFNIDKSHYGIDIVAPQNSPILNILDGVVVNSDWSDKTGHTISIQHEGNLISIFKHNSVILKRTGERVKKGEAIAIIGNTGELTSGPHVHFELWHDGAPINPANYFNFN